MNAPLKLTHTPRTKCDHDIAILEDCLDCEKEILMDRELVKASAALVALADLLREKGIAVKEGPRDGSIVTHLAVTGADGRVYRVTWAKHDSGKGGTYSVRWGKAWKVAAAGPSDTTGAAAILLYFVGLTERGSTR